MVYSTFAGLAVPIFLQPLSRIVSKNYNNAQLSVMAARDEKTHAITEALYGIRQIKFSAIEGKWQGLIMESRKKELKVQWRAYLWVLLLMITWLCMPILLGAVSLGLYVWLSKTITASVAFTSLSVFSTLEFTLSAVPINVAKLMDARISSERIQQHLRMPEKSNRIILGESIELVNATLRWPSNKASPGEFCLRQINLQFPPKQLR
jgi:ABC-type multidrug transport system fused ATPase/permease subunit